MRLAVVRGRATSTVKHRSLNGSKLLVCQFLDRQQKMIGDPVLAVDRLGAGLGDCVMLTSDGIGLRKLLNDNSSPVSCWTLGILDE